MKITIFEKEFKSKNAKIPEKTPITITEFEPTVFSKSLLKKDTLLKFLSKPFPPNRSSLSFNYSKSLSMIFQFPSAISSVQLPSLR